MKNFFLKSLLFPLAITAFGKDSLEFSIQKGEIISRSTTITNTNGSVIDFTVSPNKKKLIYIVSRSPHPNSTPDGPKSVSMWILDLQTKKLIEVAPWVRNSPNDSCCFFGEPKWNGDKLEVIEKQKNGNSPVGQMEFFLDLDTGQLHGDV